MTRNIRRRAVLSLLTTFLLRVSPLAAQTTEPTYTVTLPGKQVLHLQAQARTGRRRPQSARIFNVPVSPLSTDRAKKSDFTLEADVTLTPDGQPVRARIAFGADAASFLTFEGRRTPEGTFRVAIPEERGTLIFAAPLVTNLTAQLFLGRLYNWDKGGDQTFALLVDYGWKPVQITTLTLRSEGKETIELADGKREARKLRCEAKIPHLGDAPQKDVAYIGRLGETLQCDSALFGLPYKLRGPVKREEAKRLIGRIAIPGDLFKATLTGERTAEGYDITLDIAERLTVKTTTGPDYLPTRIESPWRGRPFTATVNGGQLSYILGEAQPETQTYETRRPWFAPYWIVTELWENEPALFGGMTVGEKRDGELPPKIAGLLQDETFTLERLADTSAEIQGGSLTARHYRLTTPKVVSDLYTDGLRLIACLNSDGLTIVRDGWESWATARKRPSAP